MLAQGLAPGVRVELLPAGPGRAASLKIDTGWPAGLQQLALMAGVVAVTYVIAAVGLGVAARFFFMVSGLAGAAYYSRRSPWLYVTLTWWFATLTPLARRLIDYHAGFDPVNYVLGTFNLMALFMLKDILTSRELLRQRETFIGLFVLVPILYGLCVNLVQGEIIPAATAVADWILPVLCYFYVIANWRRIREAEAPLRVFVSLNALVMVCYGIPQFFFPLPWDVAWVIGSRMTSIGRPEPYLLRIFGTLNAPGTLAPWLVALLLLSLHFRTRITHILFAPVLLLLLMTLVRSSVSSLIFGFLVTGVAGRASVFKFLGIALFASALALAAVSAADPVLSEGLIKRFATFGDINDDPSALARAEVYRQSPEMIAEHPFGLGIGATGRGAVASNGSDLVVVDAGPVAIFLSLGWVGGGVYFFGIILIMTQAALAARATRSGAAIAVAVTAISAASLIAGANVVGLVAYFMWTCAAYAAALAIEERQRSSFTW